MTFQAYVDNIEAKTGKKPEDFRKLAEKKGLLKPEVKGSDRGVVEGRLRTRPRPRHGYLCLAQTPYGHVKAHDPCTWAGHMLRLHGMPAEEIRAILAAEDPSLVHRYFELHRERLDEMLAEQKHELACLERLLVETGRQSTWRHA